jgi:CubicO group peptidase (beta-lactamase class C family)
MVRAVRSARLAVGAMLVLPSCVAAQETPASRITAYLSRLESYGYSGVVMVARGDSVIVHRAYGLADQKRKIPMRTDHLFDMGSVTKQFTAAAIVALEEDGKLRVTDSIGKYFANLPADKRGITMHHLLTHTSGLAMDFGGDYERVTRDEVVRRSLASELRSPPGERHAYSNAGYSLLGAVVEIVSGQPLDSFMQERLFRRAGMTSSSYFPRDTQRVVRGYRRGVDMEIAERAAATGGEMWNLIGNGGLHSTLADMHRWMRALEQDRLFSRAARDKMLRPHALHSSDYRGTGSLHYAYGWYVSKLTNGRTIVWHLGGNGTLNTAVRWHVDDGTLVLHASNTSEFHDPTHPVPVIERLLAGERVNFPPTVIALGSEELARYAGRYRLKDDIITVEVKDGFLRLRGEGQSAFWFVTRSEWEKDTVLDAWLDRTAMLVEQSRTRQWEELRKSFGSQTTVQGLADFETTFWRKRHGAHGSYVRTRPIGTEPAGAPFVARSIVAIDFERGTTVREYFWTKDGVVEDLGPLDDTPLSRQYYPITPDCFAAVAPQVGKASQICFEGESAKEMVLRSVSGGSAVTLSRER